MFEFYRRKDKNSLCYRVIAWNVRPHGEPLAPKSVVIQHQQGDCWLMLESEFWEQFEGVEDEDLPPAYRKKAAS